ncbi:hypothetical protein Y1Q_0007793 [Alligator mississippiensis]|uniref:Uncharacterized protein n=1 Tax=Alligator mississippiensis TaxID=8496 RepID=A0A151N728_ALLMI|nr:hypothetical protein Y1Q_0007793 [Alligator mississippiensis]
MKIFNMNREYAMAFGPGNPQLNTTNIFLDYWPQKGLLTGMILTGLPKTLCHSKPHLRAQIGELLYKG